MNLSVSDIAWDDCHDNEMYSFLQNQGFCGLEIAPTRIFSESPYDKLHEAEEFAHNLKAKYNLVISSMQSIWYGINENIFKSEKERSFLVEYTKKAIDFASVVGCNNLVFGCPKNRNTGDGDNFKIAVLFFKKIGEYAKRNGTIIALEPNPPIYNTNFINTTNQAFEMCKAVDSDGFKVNVDIGTMIYNNENIEQISENINMVNHIHISEPYLEIIKPREIHRRLKCLDYSNFFSIEMKNSHNINDVKNSINYIKEIFD